MLAFFLFFLSIVLCINGQLLHTVGSEGGFNRGPPGLQPPDLPFVPEEFRLPARRKIGSDMGGVIEFTNDTARLDRYKWAVVEAMNEYVANRSQTFSDVTFSYAGRKSSSFVFRVGALVCYENLSSPIYQRLSPPSPPDRCVRQECQVEMDSDAEGEGEEEGRIPSLSVAGHECRPVGNLCFSCGAPWETKCPDIDDLKNKKGLLPRPTLCLQEDTDSSSSPSSSSVLSVPCFAQFTEVAGQRSFARMGCGEPRQMAKNYFDQDESRREECRTDSAGYRQYCSCWTPLCNGVFVRDSLRMLIPQSPGSSSGSPSASSGSTTDSNEDIMRAIRQLRAHVDSALDTHSRCTPGT